MAFKQCGLLGQVPQPCFTHFQGLIEYYMKGFKCLEELWLSVVRRSFLQGTLVSMSCLKTSKILLNPNAKLAPKFNINPG